MADLVHAIYERIVVAGPTVVSASLTPAACAHGMAVVLPEVVLARPTGVGRAFAAYRILIEGRDEWLAAAGAIGVRHLADLRAGSGLTTEQPIYAGRAAAWP
jgi:hypothetical protein